MWRRARERKAAEVASDEGLGWLFVAGTAGPVSLRERRGRGWGGARDGLSSGGGRTGSSHRGAGKVGSLLDRNVLSTLPTSAGVGGGGGGAL